MTIPYILEHGEKLVRGGLQMTWPILYDSGAVVGADIPGRTVIGKQNNIGYHAVVGVKCQDLKYKV